VLTCSGLGGDGLDELWDTVLSHRQIMESTGRLADLRRRQQVQWTWAAVHDGLLAELHANPEVKALVPELERQVREGEITATLAATRILDAFHARDIRSN
jgi:LAO/AO transport system kinase